MFSIPSAAKNSVVYYIVSQLQNAAKLLKYSQETNFFPPEYPQRVRDLRDISTTPLFVAEYTLLKPFGKMSTKEASNERKVCGITQYKSPVCFHFDAYYTWILHLSNVFLSNTTFHQIDISYGDVPHKWCYLGHIELKSYRQRDGLNCLCGKCLTHRCFHRYTL